MRINYDFLDLEAFLAVKETGSFHAAAAKLNVAQSSVTRRVQKLEEALATTLFERTTRAVHPTLAAKRLQQRAEVILQEAQETTRAMRDETAAFEYQRARTVTIATIPTVIGPLLTPAIKTFRAAGHAARIRLMDLAANEVAEAVAGGEADIGISSIPAFESGTEFKRLFDEPLALAVPQDHPIAEHGSVAWSALANETLILPARGTGNRLMIDEALAQSGLSPDWTFEAQRSTTALALVADGIGVAPLPRIAVVGAKGQGISHLPLVAPEISRPLGLLFRAGHSRSNATQAMISAIEALKNTIGQTA